MALAAIVLLSLGAMNAMLASVAGTCTQGGAGNLYGGLLTLALYIVGGLILSFRTLRMWQVIALTPAVAVALWHTVFALRFAWGYFVYGISACDALDGNFAPQHVGYAVDGGEAFMAVLWLALSGTFWARMRRASRR